MNAQVWPHRAVGGVNDPLEREADAIAERIMPRMLTGLGVSILV